LESAKEEYARLNAAGAPDPRFDAHYIKEWGNAKVPALADQPTNQPTKDIQ